MIFSDFNFSGIGVERYTLYLFAEFLMVLSPGTAVLFVMSRGLAQGFLASCIATCGVLSANIVYFVVSGLGLSTLIMQYPAAFLMLQLLGAAYLVYLVFGSWTATSTSLSFDLNHQYQYWNIYSVVFLMQIANPKAMMTFAAILPPFINPVFPVWPQIAWLALGSLLPELIVLLLYGALAVSVRSYFLNANNVRFLEKLCAILLLMIAGVIVYTVIPNLLHNLNINI